MYQKSFGGHSTLQTSYMNFKGRTREGRGEEGRGEMGGSEGESKGERRRATFREFWSQHLAVTCTNYHIDIL